MLLIRKAKNQIYIKDGKKIYKIPYGTKRPLFQIRNMYPHLRNRPLVIGFIGPRGSGKSVNGTRMTVMDYMIPGKRVWSNMTIEFNYVNSTHSGIRRTEPLEKLDLVQLAEEYCDGLLLIEEINMEVADAYRAVSNKNLGFSYILQQLRKRQLDIIWNAQSELHVDSRLRFQTDIFVKCQDLKLIPGHKNVGTGELSVCKAYDYSGVVTGRDATKTKWIDPFYTWTAWNKPWWNFYDTRKMQGIENEDNTNEVLEYASLCEDIKNDLIESEKRKLPVYEIESKHNIFNPSVRRKIRSELKTFGVWLDTGNHHYILVS